MDASYRVNMSQVTGVGLSSVNHSTQTSSEFKSNLANALAAEYQSPLEKFYELHQRSQISGVPTTEYNQAIKALGLAEGDSFGAIDKLREAGYSTGMPSVQAILKYGQTNNGTGNMSFIKGGSDGFPVARAQSNTIPLASTVSTDNTTGVAVSSPKPIEQPKQNFYDAALKLVQQISSEEMNKPIDEIAHAYNSVYYEEISKQLAEYNIDSHNTKQSIESLSTLLKS